MAEALPPVAAKIDRAALLTGLYQYLGGRIESIGRRSSLMMAFLASFLAFAASPMLREHGTTAVSKMQFALSHPSMFVGLIGMAVLLWSELARIKKSDDLFSKIAFTEVDLAPLKQAYTNSSIDGLFEELITHVRLAGGFLKRKLVMYNAGCALFAVSVAMYVLGF